MEKSTNKEGLNLAGRQYSPDDYQAKDQLSSGLATTHEQASDVYTEGEIIAKIDNTNDGKDFEIPRKGYE